MYILKVFLSRAELLGLEHTDTIAEGFKNQNTYVLDKDDPWLGLGSLRRLNDCEFRIGMWSARYPFPRSALCRARRSRALCRDHLRGKESALGIVLLE